MHRNIVARVHIQGNAYGAAYVRGAYGSGAAAAAKVIGAAAAANGDRAAPNGAGAAA